MQRKPIIGIVSKHVEVENKRQDALIRDEVKNAIFDNGGIAIGILSPENEVNFVPSGGGISGLIFFHKNKNNKLLNK